MQLNGFAGTADNPSPRWASAITTATMMTRLIQKIQRRATKLALDLFYKPRGVAEIVTAGANDPSGVEIRYVAVDERTTLRVFSLKQGRLHTDCGESIAAINHRNQLVEGASWQYVNRTYGNVRDNKIFAQGIRTAPRYYDATVCSLISGGGANENYSHWLCDVLSRLHLVREAGLADAVDYYLVPALSQPFHIETLECLGISRAQAISSFEVPHLKARRLIMTDHPRPHFDDNNCEIPRWICQFLHKAFSKCRGDSPLPSNKIYINRKDSVRRQILNEEELIRNLEKAGFVDVSLTDYSFPQQVAIFHHANTVVASHGAALTNLVFCEPGTRVVEIFNDTYEYRCFESIARHCKLEYHALVCPNRDPVDKHPNHRDIIVNIPELTEIVANTPIASAVS